MAEELHSCVFCDRIDSAVVWQGEHFYLLPDIAPIMEGHLLVCAKLHYPSAADMPAEAMEELEDICIWLRSVYHEMYGAFTLFEHGRTGHCVRRRPNERICHHAHLHTLPLAEDLTAGIDLGQRTSWNAWPDVAELAGDMEGYVLVEAYDRIRFFYPVTHTLNAHYLRTLAADLVGDITRGDWEIVAEQESSVILVQRLRQWLGPRLALGLIGRCPAQRCAAVGGHLITHQPSCAPEGCVD